MKARRRKLKKLNKKERRIKITKKLIKKLRQERNKEGERDKGRYNKEENQVTMLREK
jgi:hypothetical protein